MNTVVHVRNVLQNQTFMEQIFNLLLNTVFHILILQHHLHHLRAQDQASS